MLSTDIYIEPLTAAVVGLAMHHFVFIRGEWHVRAPVVFRFYLASTLLWCIAYYRACDRSIQTCSIHYFFSLSTHYITLLASIVIYRCFFHPLRHFPGPYLAKATKFWHVWKCRNSNNHLLLEKLRHEYGNFVRTGPNEITIFHPAGLNLINKPDLVERSDWYDLVHPSFSLNTVRNQYFHDRRRKVWEFAFTNDAMKGYEERIRSYATKVDDSIRGSNRSIIDTNAIIYRFAYDVMRDLAFAKTSNDTDQEWQTSVNTIHTGLSILGPLSPAPWIALLFFSFTNLQLVSDWNNMMAYCREKMAERLALVTPKGRDISSWLIQDAKSRGQIDSPEEMQWLNGDAFSMILAGSDTTASTLIFTFWHLAKTPRYQKLIHDEILKFGVLSPLISEMSFKDFERLPFLNAFINETLRLHHPLPTAGSRIVRQKGLIIDNEHIPPGTKVVAPRWNFGRHEAHYKRAWEFLPERWLNDSDLISDRRAFTPWAGGKWACLGKQIALFELRYLISLLVHHYSISLPPGDDGSSVERDYKDQVTAFPGKLNLVFTARGSE
ncbi:putative benzoate 4-monooxygenase cytochrome P450 [Annulohypoxylon truncatum]|uniref:putative benzoate 4-monooxygenase cytochrome P450 n=1 Tax=Annulohypoxylon truncatum TaxID=327061 RepID=UPI0020072CDF|nr:putative benzoate 4-monooxygenase cytochrome P450 [Annulohypoxylon truncatum]KAI1207910.1 putative benzoate 4-monooxygenase cytochrome P450 [Annulohypoxylon truncatum]